MAGTFPKTGVSSKRTTARRRPRSVLGAGGDVLADAAVLAVAVHRRRRRRAGADGTAPVAAGGASRGTPPLGGRGAGEGGRDGTGTGGDACADPGRLPTAVRAVAAVLLLVTVGVLTAGWATGWRSHAMTTPSMGRAAPVGTLVISRPVALDRVHVGQIIVFHPPGRPGATFAHRVAALVHTTTGTMIQTKGDINATRDPWVLDQANLVGRVVLRIHDGGFVIQALPWLILGMFVILLVTTGVRRSTRLSLRIGLLALLVSGLIWHFRPLERITLLSQTVADGRGTAIVVPTGVLPLRVHARGGSTVDLTPGQVGVVRLAHLHTGGLFQILSGAHLAGWWWLLLLFWVVPIAGALAVRREPAVVATA